MNLVQGDCRCGALAFVAGENLSAATGLLVKLSAAGKAVKPGAVSDITPYVVACGAFEGYLCGVVPLSSAANCRVALKGTCQAGSLLVSAGDGRVEVFAQGSEAFAIGTAEESGVDGQRVLLRPIPAASMPDISVPADGHGVFTLDPAAVVGCPADPADLVGSVIVSDNTGVWRATGHPVTPFVIVVVTGYGGGRLVCVILCVDEADGAVSVVPDSVVSGGLGIGFTAVVAATEDGLVGLVVGVAPVYGVTYTVRALGGGRVVLKSSVV